MTYGIISDRKSLQEKITQNSKKLKLKEQEYKEKINIDIFTRKFKK